MPPAALVKTIDRTPNACSTFTGKTTCAGEYPSYKWGRPDITATGSAPRLPTTSVLAWPTAVETGQPGISA